MVKSIESIELKKKLDDKNEFILIDCREQHEWDAGHIEGATLIPLSQFPELYEEKLKNNEAEIVIQCRSGKRSLNACLFLEEKGFSNLTNLENGIIGWQAEDFKIKTD